MNTLAKWTLAATLASSPLLAQTQPNPPTAAPAGSGARAGDTTITPARVVAKLHATNQLEVKAGKLASKRGHSRGVRSYGDMLARDHEKADKELMEKANRMHLDLGHPTDPQDQEKAKTDEAKSAQLEKLRGAEFDRAFSEEMEHGHEEAISFVKQAREQVKDAETVALLDKTLPTLEHHRDLAAKLAQGDEGDRDANGNDRDRDRSKKDHKARHPKGEDKSDKDANQ